MYFFFLIYLHHYIDCSLPNNSLIAPWSTESVLLNFFLSSEAENLNPPSKIAFPYPFPYPLNEPSKIFLTEYPPGWPFSPNPPNVLPPMRSPEIPHFPHTTSQRKNGPNCHFRLGILSSDDYENPPQVFQ